MREERGKGGRRWGARSSETAFPELRVRRSGLDHPALSSGELRMLAKVDPTSSQSRKSPAWCQDLKAPCEVPPCVGALGRVQFADKSS